MPLSRRSFLAWLGGAAATAKLAGASRALATGDAPEIRSPDTSAPPVLDAVMLSRVADVVLPSELGADGRARVSRGFVNWIPAYKKGAEFVHAYGSPNLRFTGDSPAPRWRQQLDALDRAAQTKHRKSFAALPKTAREELIRSAIAAERLDRMPDPITANHVVVALVAFYFGSSEANDLCYNRAIGRNQCRPLVNSPREPLPLARKGA